MKDIFYVYEHWRPVWPDAAPLWWFAALVALTVFVALAAASSAGLL